MANGLTVEDVDATPRRVRMVRVHAPHPSAADDD